MTYAVIIVDQYTRRDASPAVIAHYLGAPKSGVLVRGTPRQGATVFLTRASAVRAIKRTMRYSERGNLGWVNNYQIIPLALLDLNRE
jgi:hypothetical protein